MTSQLEFKGYALTEGAGFSDLKVISFEPKTFEDEDVEIAITHCGVCGSDLHSLKQGWGKAKLPLIVGHEIVGKIVRVGKNVTEFRLGQRVGMGPLVDSCQECRACKDGWENYCPERRWSYGGQWPNGIATQGGYATGVRVNERYVVAIPDGVRSADAASMFCAGVTVYSPLKASNIGPGKKVGVLGIGGLGHYAILFAKAMGAEVYAFSHSENKVEDIKKMGADHVVITHKGFEKPYAQTLDIFISTIDNFGPDMPIREYLSMLYVHGKFVAAGLPDAHDTFPPLHPFDFGRNACCIGGSAIGSKKECIDMLKLAAEKGVKPWIQVLPMKDAGKAIEGLNTNKARYRYVLEQDIIQHE